MLLFSDWSSVHCVRSAFVLKVTCVLDKMTVCRYKQSQGRIFWNIVFASFSDLGIWFCGFDGFISLLPSLNWTKIDRIQRTDDSISITKPEADSFHPVQPPKVRENILGKNFHIS